MQLKLVFLLIACCALANAASMNDYYAVDSNEDYSEVSKPSSVSPSGFFGSMKDVLWGGKKKNQPDAGSQESYEKVKKEKEADQKRIQTAVRKFDSEQLDDDEDDLGKFKSDVDFVSHMVDKINRTVNEQQRKSLVEKLVEMLKNKYQMKVDKLLLQEAMLCKINDSAGEFDSLNNIRSKLRYGDIIEFKRLGYSHFSIYLGNNKLLQYETPMYNNISVRNVFSNFPSQTLINEIDKTSHGDPVRVNNKNRLNLPVNMTEMRTRIDDALGKNGTIRYNIFVHNCEHFATYVRFGFGFSDQIDALFKVGKDILYPIRRLGAQTFGGVDYA